jgi:hypothetical protein
MTKEEAMFSTSTLRRLPVALALAGAVCAFTVPQALAGGTSKDSATKMFERHFQHEDALYAAQEGKRQAVPDAFERYAASHPYGNTAPTPQRVGVPRYTPAMLAAHFNREDRLYQPRPSLPTVSPASDRIVDDSFRDPTPIVTPAGERIVDDSFRDAPAVVGSPAAGDGLDWGDFGIGAGAMLGLALLVAGLGFGTLAVRHRAGKLGTS